MHIYFLSTKFMFYIELMKMKEEKNKKNFFPISTCSFSLLNYSQFPHFSAFQLIHTCKFIVFGNMPWNKSTQCNSNNNSWNNEEIAEKKNKRKTAVCWTFECSWKKCVKTEVNVQCVNALSMMGCDFLIWWLLW